MSSQAMFHPAQGHNGLDDLNSDAVSAAQVVATGIANPHFPEMLSEILESSPVLRQAQTTNSNLQCQRCQKIFTRPASVVRHQAICQNVSLIPCELCDSSFTRLDNLHRHMRQKHRADANPC